MQLKDKVAVVTGASNGIGLAICKRYLAEGVKLVMTDIDAKKGQLEVENLDSEGEVIFIRSDVGDKSSVDQLFAKAVEHFGRVDITVANAGILKTGAFLDFGDIASDKDHLAFTIWRCHCSNNCRICRQCGLRRPGSGR